MSKIATIQECINSKYLHSDKTRLTEKDKDSKGKNFELEYEIVKKHDINYLIYRFDKSSYPFFNDISGLKLNCDYVIFAEHGNLLYVLIFELKKGTESARQQLEATEAFITYILESLKRIEKINCNNYHIRKIRISDDRIKKFIKRSIKAKDAISYDNKYYCDYPFDTIYLDRLMQY